MLHEYVIAIHVLLVFPYGEALAQPSPALELPIGPETVLQIALPPRLPDPVLPARSDGAFIPENRALPLLSSMTISPVPSMS